MRNRFFCRPGVDMLIKVKRVQPARRMVRATAWPISGGVKIDQGCSGGCLAMGVCSG